jgi:hypothetical protein
VAFDEESLPKYERAAAALLPAHASAVKLDERAANPLPVNGWTSHRFTFSYESANGPMRETVIFLNLTPDQQVLFLVTGKRAVFDEVNARAFDIIRRWHEILPEDETGAN